MPSGRYDSLSPFTRLIGMRVVEIVPTGDTVALRFDASNGVLVLNSEIVLMGQAAALQLHGATERREREELARLKAKYEEKT